MKNKLPGQLYIVATPIGNLEDISFRAVEVLKSVDEILAEDTRHSQILLSQFGIQKPLRALHEHNEKAEVDNVVKRMLSGARLAFISDAGTPLISDPGYALVRGCQDNHIRVTPIPGPSALIAALSVSGLACDRFVFEGFLSVKPGKRQKQLESLKAEPRTLIFYEAPHRILKTLEAMVECFGGEREAVLARELTKTFETVKRSRLDSLLSWVKEDANQQRGEIVLLVAGYKE